MKVCGRLVTRVAIWIAHEGVASVVYRDHSRSVSALHIGNSCIALLLSKKQCYQYPTIIYSSYTNTSPNFVDLCCYKNNIISLTQWRTYVIIPLDHSVGIPLICHHKNAYILSGLSLFPGLSSPSTPAYARK